MKFEELPPEDRRKISLKLLFLVAHLECSINLMDELSFHPEVHKFKYKKSANVFKDQAGIALKNILYDFKDESFLDENGNPVSNTDDIQLQAFKIMDKVVELNIEAVNILAAEINEA